MATIEYYCDGSRFVAAIDRGENGFFIRNSKKPDWEDWRFVVPGSTHWDSIHQDIYYTHHDLDPCPQELVAKLPPLPPVPPFKRKEWKDNFEPKEPLRAVDFPALAARISAAPGSTARFWFVIEEDLYETKFGDMEGVHLRAKGYEPERHEEYYIEKVLQKIEEILHAKG